MLVRALFLGGLVVLTSGASAQQLSISDTVSMYCRDGSGTYQPFVRTDYGRLKLAFERQFGFTSTLEGTSASQGRLTFRGGEGNAETITYVVEVHGGGIALLHMAVRLQGMTDNISGNEMCWQTFAIVNSD